MSISRDLYQATPIAIKPFPKLHKRINPYHLHDNQKLLTEEEIATLPSMLVNTNRIKFESCNNEHYTILKLKNLQEETSYYAVYYGVQQESELGQGNFGKVKLLQHLDSGKWLALKILRKSETAKSTIKNEVDALVKLGLLERFDQREDGSAKEQIYIATELIEGVNLKEFLEKHPRLSWQKRLKIAVNTIGAYIAFNQRYDLLHCDIKPENMMIDPVNYNVSLIDYQFAEEAPSTSDNLKFHLSPAYSAPELIKVVQDKDIKNRQFTYNEQTDTFSLGITLAHILNVVKELSEELTLYFPHPKFPFIAHERQYIREYDAIMSLEEVIEKGEFSNDTIEHVLDVLPLLHKMTAIEINARPAVQIVYSLLQKSLNGYVSDPFIKKTVGLLDLAEYEESSNDISMSLSKALQQMDIVWLIGDQNITDEDLLFKRSRLDIENVFVGEQFILTNGNSIPNTLLQLADKTTDQHLFYITSKTVPNELSDALTKKGIMMVQASCDKKKQDYYDEITNKMIAASDPNNNNLTPKI